MVYKSRVRLRMHTSHVHKRLMCVALRDALQGNYLDLFTDASARNGEVRVGLVLDGGNCRLKNRRCGFSTSRGESFFM